jgi:hypothetical protein
MKRLGFKYFLLVSLCLFNCTGCLSIPNSPSPKFYTLQLSGKAAESKKYDLPANLIVGVGPVQIPEYHNRPQIVTADNNGMLTFAQFQRWGEPLDSGMERLILENLSLMLPQADFQIFPCNFSIPLDYQVIVNVVQLESQLGKEVSLSTQWTIIDVKTQKMLITKKSQIRQPATGRSYQGIVRSLSQACALLSDEIAVSLSELTKTGSKVSLPQ